ELAVENLENCYEDSRNAVHYSGLFRADYQFHFAPQDVSDYSIEPTWTRVQEQDMIQLMHNHYQNIQIELQTVEIADQIGTTETKIYRQYSITGIERDNNTLGRLTLATGNLEIHLHKDYGYWYIDKWYDYRGVTGSTWGKLKHENS
ncbi:MAG: hypothetical protein PHO32_08460, partial [Candidatus Cloacimonetes bacterium]|nr:hypothetical protein [Candidatus Cloacimonadota bacterium]